ncbi:hypothetical protein CFT12S02855_08790, partial [Campylobacter fetus subsp. testudinum]|uniref:hypothetical protein n=1 Tax=Campylobacter fetus TaxID=196 RepID=UPI00082754EF
MEINSSINLDIISSQKQLNLSAIPSTNKTIEYDPNKPPILTQRNAKIISYFNYGDSPTFTVAHPAKISSVKLNGEDYIPYFKTSNHYVVNEETHKNLTSKLDSNTLNYVLFKEGNLSSDTQSIDEKQILNLMLDDMVIEQTDNIFGRLGRHNYSIYSFSQNLYVNYSYADKFNSSHKSNDNYWSNYYFNDFSYYRHNYDAPDAILKE